MVEREILIREATPDDLNDIFCLYTNYMFDSHLLKFGRPFVEKYLKAILESKKCVTLVAVESHIIGFIMATFNCKNLFCGLFLNTGILLSWIRQVLIQPGTVFKTLRLALYPFHAGTKDVDAEFLFIAIEPGYRKRDIATELIKRVLNLMRQNGIRKVKVSTVITNEAVNTLLKKLGFELRKTFELFKKHMYLYEYKLD
jgi:ribosomal protein S18 acetylase RimI-like enzyme